MNRTKTYLGIELIWRFYVSSAMWTQCGAGYPVKCSGLSSLLFRTAEFKRKEVQKRITRANKELSSQHAG